MKNELTTFHLFSPIFYHLYRRNEWGDLENEPENLTAGKVLEYEDEILELIVQEDFNVVLQDGKESILVAQCIINGGDSAYIKTKQLRSPFINIIQRLLMNQ